VSVWLSYVFKDLHHCVPYTVEYDKLNVVILMEVDVVNFPAVHCNILWSNSWEHEPCIGKGFLMTCSSSPFIDAGVHAKLISLSLILPCSLFVFCFLLPVFIFLSNLGRGHACSKEGGQGRGQRNPHEGAGETTGGGITKEHYITPKCTQCTHLSYRTHAHKHACK
jgi:hypothetical protein